MSVLATVLERLANAFAQPFGTFVGASERLFWPFLVSAAVLTFVLLGVRGGARALREGLLSRRLWAHPSTRGDLWLFLTKTVLFALVQIPWLALTAAAALFIGLRLHEWLGPAPELGLPRTLVALVYTVVLFVVWDLSRFLLHRAFHAVPALWSFHKVHHSAEVLTPLTLHRVHPVESLLYDLRGVVATAVVTGPFLYLFRADAIELELLGVNAFALVFNAAGANLRHSHVWLRFGALERLVISPAQHQMHHARVENLQRTNYGTWLAAWDRLAGTWRPAPVSPITEVGLEEPGHRPESALSMLVAPFVDLAVRIRPAARE
jgi:sterol desaturase/sphingolipid hydroxylase (fatty acid hydroxylase superfamily)